MKVFILEQGRFPASYEELAKKLKIKNAEKIVLETLLFPLARIYFHVCAQTITGR